MEKNQRGIRMRKEKRESGNPWGEEELEEQRVKSDRRTSWKDRK